MIEVTNEQIITIKMKYSDMKDLLRQIEMIGSRYRSDDIVPEIAIPTVFEIYKKLKIEE